MQITFTLNNIVYTVNLGQAQDISIPVHFDEEQLSAFGGSPATVKSYQAGDFIGSVKDGGSCNCEVYTFSPHLNGTHTECVGHISSTPLHVMDLKQDTLLPATLISVMPVKAKDTKESYNPEPQPDDRVITREMLEKTLGKYSDDSMLKALVIRTLPNGIEKKTKDYNKELPPYFTKEAMKFIVEKNVQHLLVDMPSVDRLDDEGKLTNHRIFWGVSPKQKNITREEASRKTITELVYVAESIPDSIYFLNLQVAPFEADAAPSRPVLYPVLYEVSQ